MDITSELCRFWLFEQSRDRPAEICDLLGFKRPLLFGIAEGGAVECKADCLLRGIQCGGVVIENNPPVAQLRPDVEGVAAGFESEFKRPRPDTLSEFAGTVSGSVGESFRQNDGEVVVIMGDINFLAAYGNCFALSKLLANR